MGEVPGFTLGEVLDNLLRLGVAFLLALPIGWNRERMAHGAGLRTFPLVAIGSCAFLLIGDTVAEGDPRAHAYLLYGLMSGIGFIGGGAILKDKGSVFGTATAASIWNTGAIGAGVAWQRYEIAVALALVNYLLLRFGGTAKTLVAPANEPPEDEPH